MTQASPMMKEAASNFSGFVSSFWSDLTSDAKIKDSLPDGALAAAGRASKGSAGGGPRTNGVAAGPQSGAAAAGSEPRQPEAAPAGETHPLVGKSGLISGLRKSPSLNEKQAVIVREKDENHWEIKFNNFNAVIHKKNFLLHGP